MKTLKKLFLTSLCALTLFNAQAMHTDPTEAATVTPQAVASEKIEAETIAAEVSPVVSEEDQLQAMQDEIKKFIPKIPAISLQVVISAIVWEASKDLWSVIKDGAKRAAGVTAGASAYMMSQASNATAYATDYVRNGILLAQVSDVIGSYADPESGESLHDAMQTVGAACKNASSVSTATLQQAVNTIKSSFGIMPTNAEWLQAHPYVAEGAKVAAVVAAVAATYWIVNKAVQKYKKS